MPPIAWWKRHWRSIPKRLKKIPKLLHAAEWAVLIVSFLVLVVSLDLKIKQNSNSFIVTKPAYGGEVIIALPVNANFTFLKSNEADDVVSNLIYDSLYKRDKNGKLIPSLAEKYEISSNQQEISLFLKSNTVWSDGKSISAADILYTVKQLADANISNESKFWGDVKIDIVNDKEIKFTLKEPYAFFLDHLTFPLLPAHIPEDEEREKLVGSGPFVFSKKTMDSDGRNVKKLELTANQKYFPERPKLNKIALLFFGSRDEAAAAVKDKKATMLYDAGDTSDKNTNKVAVNTSLKYALFVNESKPTFTDINVRKTFLSGTVAKDAQKLQLLALNDTQTKEVAEKLAKEYKSKNYDINLNLLEPEVFLNKSADRDYDLILVPVNKGALFDPYVYFHSSQVSRTGLNYANLKKKEIDDKILEIRHTKDENERNAKQKELDSLVDSEAVVTYLPGPAFSLLLPKNLQGFNVKNVDNPSDTFYGVSDWYVKVNKERVKK